MIIKNKTLSLLLLLASSLMADLDYKVENTNITISQGSAYQNEDKTYMYNYDRLRFRSDYTKDGYFGTVIVDGVNYLGHNYIKSDTFEYIKSARSDTPFKTQTNFKDYGDGSVYAKLYRLYGGYEDSDNRVVVGLQNISMGVGRIWTPTNLFNHRNVYALEPDEVFGVMAVSYTRHIGDTSNLILIASQREDNSFKYGARYKMLTSFGDMAIDVILSKDTTMLGYEIENNFFDTGIEVRSEVAYIENKIKTDTTNENVEYFQAILGADYGFENGVTAVVEALYSSEDFLYEEILLNLDSDVLSSLTYSNVYLGATLSYAFNIFLDGSILYVESLDDKNSRFISPSLTYTLNDYNSFTLGAMIQNTDSSSEFGASDNTYYLKWVLSF